MGFLLGALLLCAALSTGDGNPSAVSNWLRMVAQSPRSADAQFGLAEALRAAPGAIGREGAASVPAYRAALALDPGHAMAANNLAYVLNARLERTEEALEALHVAAALATTAARSDDGGGGHAWATVARVNKNVGFLCWNRLGRHAEAIGAFTRAVEAVRAQVASDRSSDTAVDIWTHNHLGIVLSRRAGRHAEAVAVLREGAALADRAADRAYALATVLDNVGMVLSGRLGRHAEAAEALAHAAALDAPTEDGAAAVSAAAGTLLGVLTRLDALATTDPPLDLGAWGDAGHRAATRALAERAAFRAPPGGANANAGGASSSSSSPPTFEDLVRRYTPPPMPPGAAPLPAQAIPRTIWQTFAQWRGVPASMASGPASWRAQNPEYRYRLLLDDEIEAEVVAYARAHGLADAARGHDGALFRAKFRALQGAERADVWRAVLMASRGGVYADLDTTCARPLRAWLRAGDRFVTALGPGGMVFQHVLVAAPGHPAMVAYAERSIRNVLRAVAAPGDPQPEGAPPEEEAPPQTTAFARNLARKTAARGALGAIAGTPFTRRALSAAFRGFRVVGQARGGLAVALKDGPPTRLTNAGPFPLAGPAALQASVEAAWPRMTGGDAADDAMRVLPAAEFPVAHKPHSARWRADLATLGRAHWSGSRKWDALGHRECAEAHRDGKPPPKFCIAAESDEAGEIETD